MFWPESPGPDTYVPLLKRTYEEIKRVDPNLKVVYGGTAGVPLDFIEGTFKAGAGNYFDIMCIHPYRFRGVPEELIPQIDGLKQLMKKYRLENKPLWFSEIGWSSSSPSPYFRSVLPALFRKAGLEPKETTVAIVSDIDKMFPSGLHLDPQRVFPEFRDVKIIKLDQLRNIDIRQYPVIVPSTDEDFPAAYIPQLVDYVRRGGTLLLPFGVPFYYDQQANGKRVDTGLRFMKDFHIGWDAWWLKDVPQEAPLQPAADFAKAFGQLPAVGNRYLHTRNLAPGDEFIPAIDAVSGKFRGHVVGIYKFNSDLKGKIIISTLCETLEGVSVERQAELLSRTYLVALSHGVDRVFWYCLRSRQENLDTLESHFGVLHENGRPKPSFAAYRTLIRLLPVGSTIPQFRQTGQICTASWTRPDGVKVWAFWTIASDESVSLNIIGNVFEVRNHLGEKLPDPGKRYTLTTGPVYLLGPDSVSVQY